MEKVDESQEPSKEKTQRLYRQLMEAVFTSNTGIAEDIVAVESLYATVIVDIELATEQPLLHDSLVRIKERVEEYRAEAKARGRGEQGEQTQTTPSANG